jgi:hypothetical protein
MVTGISWIIISIMATSGSFTLAWDWCVGQWGRWDAYYNSGDRSFSVWQNYCSASRVAWAEYWAAYWAPYVWF